MAIALIELDASTRQCVWSYPSIDNGTEQQLITRASQLDERTNVFFFSKHKQVWQYYLAVPGPSEGPAKVVTLCLLSAQFAPEKCEALLRVLAAQYVGSSCNPQVVLALYLEVFTQKQVGKASPSWRAADFDEKTPLLGGSLSDVSKIKVIFGVTYTIKTHAFRYLLTVAIRCSLRCIMVSLMFTCAD